MNKYLLEIKTFVKCYSIENTKKEIALTMEYRSFQYYESKVLHNTETTWF